MNHGPFLRKCQVVGWPLWAMRAHAPFLLRIHSRSPPLSVSKFLGDRYAWSSPAFPEQGLSIQETCSHWAPGWCKLFLSNSETVDSFPSLHVLGHQAGTASVIDCTASGMAFLASRVTPNVSQPASSEDTDLWLQLCLAFRLAPLPCLSFWTKDTPEDTG